MIPFFSLWCLIKLVGRGEATHGYEKVGWVRAELSWRDGAVWFVLNFFFSPVDLVFEMFPLKKCLFILLHFFFLPFSFSNTIHPIHNQISVSRVKTRI